MTPSKTLLTLAAAAAVAVPTASAMADGGHSTTLSSPNAVKVVSGYAYFDSFKPRNRPLIMVVVKTKGQMPRRFDGLVRAQGSLGKHGGSSVGSVGGRQSRCYTFSVPLKDGRFYPVDGGDGKGARVKVGGHYVVTMKAKDADGKTVTGTKTITLRHRKAGDRSGKPIGC